MKFSLVIFLSFFYLACLSAQTLDTSLVDIYTGEDESVFNDVENKFSNTSFGVSTGASFSKISGLGSFHSTFVSPYFDHTFKSKFTLRGGMTYVNSTINHGFKPYTDVKGYNPNSQYVSLYAEGEYQFSERLHVTGAVRKGVDNSGMPNPYTVNYFDDMLSIGLYYQITKNLKIGAEISTVKYPAYNNLFPGSYYDPFR